MLKTYRILRYSIGELLITTLLFLSIGYYIIRLWNSPSAPLPDYIQTFDSWWYFHHRLRGWEIAQWNPYYFLGSIAVQWNFVPVNLFTPLLAFIDLTPKIFWNICITYNILVCLTMYLSLRILKYSRLYSIIPIVFIYISPYIGPTFQYNQYNIVFVMPLLLFPLVFALIYSISDRLKIVTDYRFGLIGLLLGLSFTGARLEYIVHETAFLSIFFMTSLVLIKKNRERWRYLLCGIALFTIALSANLWHMALTSNSALESGRVSIGIDYLKILDISLWKWLLVILAFQPYLILFLLNIIIYRIIPSGRQISKAVIAVIVGLEFLSPTILVWIRKIASTHIDTVAMLNSSGYGDIGLFHSKSMLLISIVGMVLWFMDEDITLKGIIEYAATMFGGFYILEQIYMVYDPAYPAGIFVIINLLIFGIFRLIKSGRFAIPLTLVLFTFFETTLKYPMYEITGIAWVEDRDFIFILPSLAIIGIESVKYLFEKSCYLINRFYCSQRAQDFKRILGGLFVISLLFCIIAKTFALSISDIHFITHSPLNAATITLPNMCKAIDEYRRPSDMQRIYIPEILGGIYSYSKILNASHCFYSGEIPSLWWHMFEPAKDERRYINTHPEMSPLFFYYLRYKYGRDFNYNPRDYGKSVSIRPDTEHNQLHRELSAMEGFGIKRIFITEKLVRFRTYREEYFSLNEWIRTGHLLSSRLTTSDPAFHDTGTKSIDLKYNLDILRDYPEYIELKSKSNGDGYLVLMDSYSKGWRAFVDGVETRIYRGYIGLRFIRLTAGVHNVEFKFECPRFKTSLIVSIISWIVIIVMTIVFLIKRSHLVK